MWQIWTHPAPNHPTNPTSTTQNLDTPRITFTARVGQFQCTYRCVVLPDQGLDLPLDEWYVVSMHLQVRGAP